MRRFVDLPFRIYRGDAAWVPPLRVDAKAQLDRRKNPFFEHSDADFFVATQNGLDVGRIAAIENRRFNRHHGSRKAQFSFFECIDDRDVADALFRQVFRWARERGLDTVIGPKGLGALDGHGLLIDGFDQRQMMAMMNHNPPYYVDLVESQGFHKEVDFVSFFLDLERYHLPERIRQIADRVERRGTLRVRRFRTAREVKAWASRIGRAYNEAFVDNWEYYPLTEREIEFVVKTLETVGDPTLIRIIVHDENVAGFLFAFPDAGDAIRRSGGRLLPIGLPALLLEMRRTDCVAVNTMGILPAYHGVGGNALLYAEMERTVRQRFARAVLYQVAETAVEMRRDLESLGAVAYKTHRVYVRHV